VKGKGSGEGLDLGVIEWEHACGLASEGQAKKLLRMLRDPRITIPEEAREWLAQLVQSVVDGRPLVKRLRKKPKLEEEDLSRIRLILRHMARSGYTREERAEIVYDLAHEYDVTASTVRDVAAAKRKRYTR
jgi:chromosomal replication initiation ATPase DnaA